MTYYNKKGQVIRNPRAYYATVRRNKYGYNRSSGYNRKRY